MKGEKVKFDIHIDAAGPFRNFLDGKSSNLLTFFFFFIHSYSVETVSTLMHCRFSSHLRHRFQVCVIFARRMEFVFKRWNYTYIVI